MSLYDTSPRIKAGVAEVERLLKEQYGVTLDDCAELSVHVTLEAVQSDLANGEDCFAIVECIAIDCNLSKLVLPESKETRALRIAMLGKRAEFDIYGNRINPNENLGPVVTDDGEGWDDGDDDNDM